MAEPVSTKPIPSVRLVVAVTAVYTALIFTNLPRKDPSIGGFSHDSAYIAIVAQNLLDGRGFVNDAHWLVFLQPDQLPMPYHNANPLYPLLVAAVSLTGLSLLVSGFVVSFVASGFAFAAVLVLSGRYVEAFWKRVVIAWTVMWFPSVYESTVSMVPDMLCLAFSLWAAVFLVRKQDHWSTIAGGVCFGLAWLSRSSVILMVPALVLFLILSEGWRRTGWRLVWFGLAVVVVASPWLVHQTLVWGNPLRSDSQYYLLQDYHAQKFEGSVPRYWHSPETPASLSTVLREEPSEFVLFWLRGIPKTVYKLVAEWTRGNMLAASLLGILGLFALFQVWRVWRTPDLRRRYLPDLAALVGLAVTLVLVFSVRPLTLEIRYFLPLSVVLVMSLMTPMVGSFEKYVTKDGQVVKWQWSILVIVAASLWVGVFTLQRSAIFRESVGFDTSSQAQWKRSYLYRVTDLADKSQFQHPVVVGDSPYYLTVLSGVPALSMPQSDDAYLLDYMKRYNARHVLLTRNELEFWRPDWQTQLPSWLKVVQTIEPQYPSQVELILLERKPGP